MIEIKNKERGPIQLMVRSRTGPRAFTTLIIPGVGRKKNVVLIEDEKTTNDVDRAEKAGHISTRHVPNNKLKAKGD